MKITYIKIFNVNGLGCAGEGEGSFKEHEGTGMGEGEGAKDISDKIENEDQMQGAQQKGQGQPEVSCQSCFDEYLCDRHACASSMQALGPCLCWHQQLDWLRV